MHVLFAYFELLKAHSHRELKPKIDYALRGTLEGGPLLNDYIQRAIAPFKEWAHTLKQCG